MLPQVQVGDVVVACCVLSVASEQSHLLHFRERETERQTQGRGRVILILLPGFIYNYMKYSSATYLRNNFVDHGTVLKTPSTHYCLYMRNVSGESSKWALCTFTNFLHAPSCGLFLPKILARK